MAERHISDREILRVVLPYLQEWENWRPWHDFKFAVANGVDIQFFWDVVTSALVHAPWEAPAPERGTGLEQRILELLRERAEKEVNRRGRVSAVSNSWARFYPNPDWKNIRSLSKRAGDKRKYSEDEVSQAANLIRHHFPQIPHAIERAAEHNRSLAYESDDRVNVYSWTLNPLKHAIFKLHGDLDSLDNSELARRVFYLMAAEAKLAHPPRQQPNTSSVAQTATPLIAPNWSQRMGERARFRKVLRELHKDAVNYEYVPIDSELTKAAKAKLQAIFAERAFLAVGQFAFDVYHTLSDALSDEKPRRFDYIQRELVKLYMRVQEPSFRTWPTPLTRHFAAKLGIGLGPELNWLMPPITRETMSKAKQWFADFSPGVKRFMDFTEQSIPTRMRKLDRIAPR